MDTKKLRQKILDLAIRGKLVPQDPNDEPASVLLDRIRAEKERLIAEGKIKRPKKSKSTSADTSQYQNFEPPFEIPDSWEWVKLGEICDKFSTGPFGSTLHKSDYSEIGVPLINPANILVGNISSVNIKRVNESKASSLAQFRLTPTDIVLPRRGNLRKCAIISKTEDNWLCGTGSFVLHLVYILPAYFLMVYQSEYCQDILISESVGGTMDNLNQDLLRNLLIPIPPEKEQNRIVEFIAQLSSIISSLDFDSKSLISEIATSKSKILDLAMQGMLVPQDPADESAADMLRRVNPKAEIIGDNPHYPQLPDKWVVTTLESITEYYQPQPYIVQNTDYSKAYTIPVLTAGKSFILGYTNETEGVFDKLPVIIFDDFTTDSHYVDFEFKVKSSAMKIISVYEPISVKFISHYMSITRLVGDTHKRYWISEYSKLPIALPPLNEQQRIVAKIEELYSILDEIEASLQA